MADETTTGEVKVDSAALDRKLENTLREAGFPLSTAAQKKLGSPAEPPSAPEAPLVTDGVREPTHMGSDELSPEEMRKFGIEDPRQISWIRNDQHWTSINGSSRTREWMGQHKGGRIVRDGGQYVFNGDRVLAVKSLEEVREREQAERERFNTYLGTVKDGDVPGTTRHRDDRIPTRQDMARQHEQNVARGLIGPTAGQNMNDIIRRKGSDAVIAEQARYARVRLQVGVPDSGPQRERMDAARRAVAGNKSSFAIGASFDKDGKIVK